MNKLYRTGADMNIIGLEKILDMWWGKANMHIHCISGLTREHMHILYRTSDTSYILFQIIDSFLHAVLSFSFYSGSWTHIFHCMYNGQLWLLLLLHWAEIKLYTLPIGLSSLAQHRMGFLCLPIDTLQIRF